MLSLFLVASSFAMDVHDTYVSTDILSDGSTCSDVEIWTPQGCVGMPEFVRIASADADVGSPRSERGRRGDERKRSVRLGASYAMSVTEVTVGQYRLVMGADAKPACEAEWGQANDPVTCVSWEDAVAFMNRLSSSYGLEPAYRALGGVTVWERSANGFRLPSEVEWEHAARAADESVYAGSDRLGLVAWSKATSQGRLHAVGGLTANGWGLHDMSGNAAEWVWDAYQVRPSVDVADEGWHRVIRGGGYDEPSHAQRVASRASMDLSAGRKDVGFRIARTLP